MIVVVSIYIFNLLFLFFVFIHFVYYIVIFVLTKIQTWIPLSTNLSVLEPPEELLLIFKNDFLINFFSIT